MDGVEASLRRRGVAEYNQFIATTARLVCQDAVHTNGYRLMYGHSSPVCFQQVLASVPCLLFLNRYVMHIVLQVHSWATMKSRLLLVCSLHLDVIYTAFYNVFVEI